MNKLVLLSCILLVGCGPPYHPNSEPTTDVCLQKQYFDDCLKQLPEGPKATHYNDWSEIVSSCTESARLLSYRQSEFVTPECRTGF